MTGKDSARLTHDLELITGQRLLRFFIFERDPHTPGQMNWKTVNMNFQQMWASFKKEYLRNDGARFKPFWTAMRTDMSLPN